MDASGPATKPVLFEYSCRDFLAGRHSWKGHVDSKLFDGGSDLEGQWALRVSGRVQMYVQLLWVPPEAKEMNLLRPVKSFDLRVAARFQIMMIDAAGRIHKTVEGYTADPCVRSAFVLPFPSWSFNFCSMEDLHKNHEMLLPGGQLLLRCRIWAEERCLPNFVHLSNDFGKLFHDGARSDVTVVVFKFKNSSQEKRIPAHKIILGARSPVFAAMFNHDILENEIGMVRITDFDFEVVYAMLKYMYTETVDKELLAARAPDLLQISDKYFLDGLRDRCETTLESQLSVDNAIELFILSNYLERCSLLKQTTKCFLKKNKNKIIQTPVFRALSEENSKLIFNL